MLALFADIFLVIVLLPFFGGVEHLPGRKWFDFADDRAFLSHSGSSVQCRPAPL